MVSREPQDVQETHRLDSQRMGTDLGSQVADQGLQ
jgi:hypothetical protein